ncbi:hypothetical protein Aduo_004700 [Ancylostoma duodenale]
MFKDCHEPVRIPTNKGDHKNVRAGDLFEEKKINEKTYLLNFSSIFEYVVRSHPRHLRITLVILTFVFILYSGIIPANRTSSVGTVIMRDRSIEAVNIRARTVFGNVAFSDDRLQLLDYTIVPDQKNCVGNDFIVVVQTSVGDERWRNAWRQTYGSSLLMQKELVEIFSFFSRGCRGWRAAVCDGYHTPPFGPKTKNCETWTYAIVRDY